jgi:tRNA-2-methylthio-N6-dimethylallyladenosine synthase
MNKAESESLLLAMNREGWTRGESAADADIIVLNTCAVRETAEERVRGRLGFYRHVKKARPFTLVMTGCMAERLKERISEEYPEVDVVVGTFHKKDIVSAIKKAGQTGKPVVLAGEGDYDFAVEHHTGGVKAFVPIMHGCDNRCTYCIVPVVRGREVSRSPEGILAEIRELEERGVRSITLLGQNVNSYRAEAGQERVTFAGLLRRVAGASRAIRWIRFLTSHPKDFPDELLEVLAADKRFCRHLHLPLQSGSSWVLERMGRGYSAEEFRALVERIRAALRDVAITTDILVGFPGESDRDFLDTLRILEEVGFDEAFTYHYNPREGTPAFDMQDALSDQVKRERLMKVIETQRRITELKARSRIGSSVVVMVEDVSRKDASELLARTEWDSMVVLPGDKSLVGSFISVRLQSLNGNTYRASHE